MTLLELDSLSFWYDESQPPIVYDCSFRVDEKDFVAVVGESGSGKSTLLRIACGLIQSDYSTVKAARALLQGAVRYRGEQVTKPHSSFAYVPQAFQPSLIPTKTAIDNILVAVAADGISAEERDLASELMNTCGISGVGHLRAPRLSGGQQQRVAICRALITEPQVLFMDEPFANLDPTLKPGIASLLRTIRARKGLCVVVVTHDIVEQSILLTN